jgi:hypothetical protein
MNYDLFARQHGLISRAQAIEAGISPRMISTRLARGELIRVGRGVYRHPVTPGSWEQDMLAACLEFDAVASHRSAASLWRIESYRRGTPEIAVPRGQRVRRAGLIVHESKQPHLIDQRLIDQIPVTGPARTVLDLGAVMNERRVERAAESLIRRGHLSWTDLLDCLVRHSRRGRNGCGRLRRVLDRRLDDQAVPRSEWSRLVANLLVDDGLPAPVVEYVVTTTDGQHLLALDLAWPQFLLGVELDSLSFHGDVERNERDKHKRNRLRSLGWRLFEVTKTIYRHHPDEISDWVRGELATASNIRSTQVSPERR